MRFDDTAISPQNLLTCCVYTLLQMGDDKPNWEVGNGTEVDCRKSGNNYSHKMILWNGVWRWINPHIVVGEESDRLRKGGKLDRFRSRLRSE